MVSQFGECWVIQKEAIRKIFGVGCVVHSFHLLKKFNIHPIPQLFVFKALPVL